MNSYFILKTLLFLKRFKKLEFPPLLIVCFLITGCHGAKIDKNASVQLRFLDEYVIPKNLVVSGTKIGGLSGIDFDGEHYYVICDLPSNPRIYKLSISLQEKKIDTIKFLNLIEFQSDHHFMKTNVFDSESILYDKNSDVFTVSGEGSISKGKDPSVVELNDDGSYLDHYQIPDYFKANSSQGPRNNGLFEGLTKSVDDKGIWVGTELPLKADGPKPKLYRTKSPVRMTYYDEGSKKPKKQFSYLLGRVRKLPLLPFIINGMSDFLQIGKDKFLVIERAFSAGHGMKSFRILLYEADISKATNTLNTKTLKGKIGKTVTSAKKKLVFDFQSIHKQLSHRAIDNIEGISFGPRLPNGNKSLLLISDNNFNSIGKQLNQVILMELVPQ